MKKINVKKTYACLAIAVSMAPLTAAISTAYAAENNNPIYTDEIRKVLDFETDKEEGEKWAEEYFANWRKSLSNEEKKLFDNVNRLEEINKEIEQPPKDGLTNSILKDIEKIDKSLNHKDAKLNHDLYVYKDLKNEDLGYPEGFFYGESPNMIDQESYNKFANEFKYGTINSFMQANLSRDIPDKSSSVVLSLKIPKGSNVGHLHTDRILLERDQGIEIKGSSIITVKGRQVIKLEGEVVSKDKITEKIKLEENSLNQEFKDITNSLQNLMDFKIDNLYSSVNIERIRNLNGVFVNNISSELINPIIEKMNQENPIIITDKSIENLNDGAEKNSRGFYDKNQKIIYIKLNHADHLNQKKSEIATLLHEFGFAVNDLLIKDTILSETEEFKHIYAEEKDKLSDIGEYTNEREFFAEVFQKMYSSDENEIVEQRVPKSVEYIKEKIEFITSDKTNLDGINVVEGKKAIEGSGLVPEHIEKFKSVAKDKNTFILVRPVNKLATSLIKNGAATKGMNVHGKSADWGPGAGYIPFDQDLSKKHGNKEAVEKGNADNKESLEEHADEISKVTLKLDEERVNELKKEGILTIGGTVTENGRVYQILQTENEIYEFRIDTKNLEVQYKTKEGKHTILGEEFGWRNIEVMAKIVEGDDKPLTADYDLFSLAPTLKEIKKLIPLHEWNQAVLHQKPLEKLVNITNLLVEYGFKREAFPGQGQMPKWQLDIIDALNKAAQDAGYTGGTVVNHGTEQDNENFPEQDNEIFVITPDGKLILTKSWEDTRKFIEKNVVKNGYFYYFNRSYNKVAPGNKKVIEWTDPITKLKTDTIPTEMELKRDLNHIKEATNKGRINESALVENSSINEEIQEISNRFMQYYDPVNNLIVQEEKYKISIFRGLEALEALIKLKDLNIMPNKQYEDYFQILQNRVEDQLESILEKEKYHISLEELFNKIDFSENENENFEQLERVLK
ncbi:calmodulin-sensitive adenylate cyclase [Bacillus cereus]|uniref:anthrax toxin-like adenylyl cyclase domain-containing protein n=1 Tax=Bacillus cereus TaxID=1396 RepID=UPI000BFE6022|nr:anthrax toxin-like adenylyl cyclase domain-containing protein [Bacillus cereus]PGT97491.1 calmodulin-sensitive adenylate cyclase [Bacillus cereus]